MISAATSFSRLAIAQTRLRSQCHLSSTCKQSVHKLYDILEDYRTSNYSQELSRRFRKDVVKAACKKTLTAPLLSSSPHLRTSPSEIVSADGIEHVLRNIGADHLITRSEIEMILREVGGSTDSNNEVETCVISSDQMFDLISGNRAA